MNLPEGLLSVSWHILIHNTADWEMFYGALGTLNSANLPGASADGEIYSLKAGFMISSYDL